MNQARDKAQVHSQPRGMIVIAALIVVAILVIDSLFGLPDPSIVPGWLDLVWKSIAITALALYFGIILLAFYLSYKRGEWS